MLSENSCNMWVFREGRSTVSGRSLQQQLRASVLQVFHGSSMDTRVDALLRAGEVECTLLDAASPYSPHAGAVTDATAAALAELPGWPALLAKAASLLGEIALPESVIISPPEGFAYYALHPLDLAALAGRVAPASAPVAVVGIRSIGVTLSAVVMAALIGRGTRAERTTVRPVGHPYDRRTTLSPEQLRWVARQRAASAQFLVVDEGPGISGSSFISVGEALLEAGVARECILFLGSRDPDPEKLTARDGAVRWRSFHAVSVPPTEHVPEDRGEYLGGGEWRRRSYDQECEWPASWVQMERLKFLSRDRRRIFKFHGLGRFGDAVAERARLLGETGFGPRMLSHAGGFSEFELAAGRPMHATLISAAVLERVADYCVLRALEFGARRRQAPQLEEMARFNIGEEFGYQPDGWLAPLNSDRLVIADGRMQPHEWLLTPAGTLLKTDNATHGDDHFFPGPVDIAWDLAGAVVEWGMSAEAARYMLARYRLRSGDDARGRMDAYLLAYSVFRMGYCAMAAFALRGWDEEPRLRHAALHYRRLAEAQLKSQPLSLRGPVQAANYGRARAVGAEPESRAS
jgi:hypothetical protein